MAYSIRPEYGILSYSLPSIIPIFVGVMLLLFPGIIERKITSSVPDKIKIYEPRKYLYIGCFLIGVVFLFFSLSDLIFHFSAAIVLINSAEHELSLLNYDYPSALATVVELLFALVLVFKTDLFLNFILRKSE